MYTSPAAIALLSPRLTAARFPAVVLVTCLAAACSGGGGSPTSPTSPGGSGQTGSGGAGNTDGSGTVTATLDGVSYVGTVTRARHSNRVLWIQARNAAGTELDFDLGSASVGTHTVAYLKDLAIQVRTTNGGATTATWMAWQTTGSGTFTVTSLTATGASGSFAFTVVPHASIGGTATGTRTATGTFSVQF